jgi:hypothetical protein
MGIRFALARENGLRGYLGPLARDHCICIELASNGAGSFGRGLAHSPLIICRVENFVVSLIERPTTAMIAHSNLHRNAAVGA